MQEDVRRVAYTRLRDAIQSFVNEHHSGDIQRFRPNLTDWGEQWQDVTPGLLPAAEYLEPSLVHATDGTRELIARFARERAKLKWEQSYTKADGVVGDDMLNGYGFAEVIGKRGPFVSERVRTGIGIWGPGIDYPAHRHQAEEIYVVLTGEIDFLFGDSPRVRKQAGDVIYVPSMLTHGFNTCDHPMAVLYIWQAGNLRETSTFD